MATKRICDRCGAEINPISSATYVNVRSASHEESPDIELCCSCAMQIKEWLKSRVEEGKKDGCKYCRSGDRTLYQESREMRLYFEPGDPIYGKPALLAETVMHCPPYVDCTRHNRPYGTFFWIKYCPECGRKLGGDNDNEAG